MIRYKFSKINMIFSNLLFMAKMKYFINSRSSGIILLKLSIIKGKSSVNSNVFQNWKGIVVKRIDSIARGVIILKSCGQRPASRKVYSNGLFISRTILRVFLGKKYVIGCFENSPHVFLLFFVSYIMAGLRTTDWTECNDNALLHLYASFDQSKCIFLFWSVP